MVTEAVSQAEFVEFVRRVKLGVVATVDQGRGPEAALVDLAVTDGGDVLFDSWGTARKVVNLATDPRVAIVVSQGAVTMQAEGVAEVLTGAEREEAARFYSDQVPDGHPTSAGFAVIRVRIGWVRRYQATSGKPEIREAVWA